MTLREALISGRSFLGSAREAQALGGGVPDGGVLGGRTLDSDAFDSDAFDSATLDAEVLLMHAAGVTREQMIAHRERPLAVAEAERFENFLLLRREGKPVAQIIGECEFFGLPFFVDERVLIPRPETELLVEHAITRLAALDAEIAHGRRLLEIGTGSGAIAIAIASRLPELRVLATDVSLDALEVAARNVERHKVRPNIELLHSDLCAAVPREEFIGVVANLPYGGEGKAHFFADSVLRYEPHTALFGGPDGLDLYRKLLTQIGAWRMQPHFIIGEFGFSQEEPVREICERFAAHAGQKWTYEIQPDLAGIPRVFILQQSDG